MRDALRSKGYAVDYAEVPNGEHSPASWRERLPGALVRLLRERPGAVAR